MFIKNKKTDHNDSNYTLHSAEISFCEKQVQDIQELISTIPEESDSAVQPTREQFTRLLAELAVLAIYEKDNKNTLTSIYA